MSVWAINWALGKASVLEANKRVGAQAVLFALANRCDKVGVTFVGQKALAIDCACSEKHTERALNSLEAAHLIARVERRDNRGRRTSDHTILAPLASDRGEMLDAEETTSKHPRHVLELARECTDREHAARVLTDSLSGRGKTRQPDRLSVGTEEPDRQPVHARPTACPAQTDRLSDEPSVRTVPETVSPFSDAPTYAEAQPLPLEARPSAAHRLTAEQVNDLVAYWVDQCQPGSEVNVTEARAITVRSRYSHDGFTIDELKDAIDGVAQADHDGVLEHARWDREFSKIFRTREVTQALVAYHHHGDDLALLEVLSDARNEARAA